MKLLNTTPCKNPKNNILTLLNSFNFRETGIWVSFKEGVYDITDFVSKHPGGENILLGAGTSIEPFWMIYSVHHTDEVYEMLEEMRIGKNR